MNSEVATGAYVQGGTLRLARVRAEGSRLRVTLSERSVAAAGSSETVSVNGATRGAPTVGVLACNDVLSRCWEVPAAGREQVRQIAAYRLEAEMPLPLEQLSWDVRVGAGAEEPGAAWQVGDSTPANAHLPILVQAARRERVRRMEATLGAAGLRAAALTSAAEALGALVRLWARGSGANRTMVVILAAAGEWLVVLWDRGLPRMFCHMAGSEASPVQRVRQCRQAVEGCLPVARVQRWCWVGDDGLEAERASLAAQLGADVERLAPPQELADEAGVPLPPERLARFGPAIGAALLARSLDEPWVRFGVAGAEESAAAKRRRRWITAHPWRWVGIAAGMLALAAGVHVGGLAWEVRQMRATLERMPASTTEPPEIAARVRAMQRIETYRLDVERIVAALCRPVPESVELSSIRLARDRRLVIQGKTGNPRDVYALAEALRQSPRFYDVNPETTEPGRGGGFTLSAQVRGVSALPAFEGQGAAWR